MGEGEDSDKRVESGAFRGRKYSQQVARGPGREPNGARAWRGLALPGAPASAVMAVARGGARLAAMSRLRHRLNLFSDRDVLHAMAVTGAACVLSAGLVYLGYFVHVLRVARKAPCLPALVQDDGSDHCVLVFGKHAPRGLPDADFSARLDRAAALWRARAPRHMVLLGGGPAGLPTEAELAHAGLLARGIARDAPLVLESASRDTLQNLRNARDLLAATAARGRVVLLSSRYHLARCALFARQLGLDAEVCAAEARFTASPRTLWRLAGEAGYVCLSDLGTRWARLIRHRRMLSRVT